MNGKQAAFIFVVVMVVLSLVSECTRMNSVPSEVPNKELVR